MQLKFWIDQARAFQAGLDTTSPHVELDVDPSTLCDEERRLLASRLNREGKVCSRNADGGFHDGGRTQEWLPTRDDNFPHNVIQLVTALAPTLEGLLEAIRQEEAAIQARNAHKAQQAREQQDASRAATQQVLEQRTVTKSARVIYAWYEQETLRVEDRAVMERTPLADVLGQAHYAVLAPAWPARPDMALVEGPEAQAWRQHLADVTRTGKDAAAVEATALLHTSRARKEADEARKRQEATAQAAQIATWVQQHGSANHQARQAEGLLPREEVLDALREEAFTALDGWARYERLKASDLCTCDMGQWDESRTCKADFDSGTMEHLTAEQYEQVLAVRQLLPDATVLPRWHTGHSADCDQDMTRYSLRVTRTVGAFTFTREYALA